jgi:predicted LPLAT superfamily acyltransferase
VTVSFAPDAAFWRELARFGAARGPEWWVRYSPPVFGLAAAVMIPGARRAVRANLRRLRGERGPLRDSLDVARTFAGYASCLAEVLSSGSKNERLPDALLCGEHNLELALRSGIGLVVVTAHTGGWETVGPLLKRSHGRDFIIVMAPEADDRAREVHDRARAAAGVRVAHVGDAFGSLGLLKELRRGAVVALQIDRLPPGMRTRAVSLLGAPGAVPEGPLRLASAAGAPIVPIFCARSGYRQYRVDVRPPIFVPRRPSEPELDAAAQTLAGELGRFLRANPTQWFDFRAE